MYEVKTSVFDKGIVNYPNDPELVPRGAASDALGWTTKGGYIELSRGKSLVGANDTSSGVVRGQHFGYAVDGSEIHFRKVNTRIQFYNTLSNRLRPGYALSFDGNDYVSIPSAAVFNNLGKPLSAGGTSYSISFWFKTSTKADHSPSEKWPGGAYPWAIRGPLPTSGTVRFVIYDGVSASTDVLADNKDYADGAWHHIVCVRDLSAAKMYMYADGALINQSTDALATVDVSNTGVWSIGARTPSATSNNFTGNIDDFRVYSKALSSTEVANLYNGITISSSNLIGQWKFDEGSGTTATDSSTSAQNGTINGATYTNNRPTYIQNTWVDVITGLTLAESYTFADHNTLTGSFVYASGYDGLFKINLANPDKYLDLTSETYNFKHPGKIIISDNRMFMWGASNTKAKDRTGLYLSYIDLQLYVSQSLVTYGTGNGSTTINGIISSPSFGAQNNIFGIVAYGPIGTLKTVSNVTKASNGIVTATGHGFSTGDYVVFSNFFDSTTGTGTIDISGSNVTGFGTSFTTQLKVGSKISVPGGAIYTVSTITDNTHMTIVESVSSVTGVAFSYYSMKELNKVLTKITVIDANSFYTNINTTSYQPYSSGGKVAKAEYFTDDNNGNLNSNYGGTGTVNYINGAISTTFSQAPITSEAILVNFQVENSLTGGLADFTHSATRLAGQGDVFRQDEGGDAIQKVEALNGVYYSMKERSAYELNLTADDTNATNLVYRRQMGMPSYGASVSTANGIIFMNTANPDQPKLTILKPNPLGNGVVPDELAPQFDFFKYTWDECWMDSWGEYIAFTGKENSSVNNRLFLYSEKWKSVDVFPYSANTLAKSNGLLYLGDSGSNNVYKVFSGFTDNGSVIQNYWISGADLLTGEEFKRERRLTLEGFISSTQSYDVYISLDDGTFTQLGTVSGTGSYVDSTTSITLDGVTAYHYLTELKINTAKFYRRRLKFVATATGYVSISMITDKEILGYGSRIPKKYRTN